MVKKRSIKICTMLLAVMPKKAGKKCTLRILDKLEKGRKQIIDE